MEWKRSFGGVSRLWLLVGHAYAPMDTGAFISFCGFDVASSSRAGSKVGDFAGSDRRGDGWLTFMTFGGVALNPAIRKVLAGDDQTDGGADCGYVCGLTRSGVELE
jgi:hypothetical protein